MISLLSVRAALFGILKGKTPLGRPRRRREYYIKMHLKEEKCGGMDWIELARERDRWRALLNAMIDLQVT